MTARGSYFALMLGVVALMNIGCYCGPCGDCCGGIGGRAYAGQIYKSGPGYLPYCFCKGSGGCCATEPGCGCEPGCAVEAGCAVDPGCGCEGACGDACGCGQGIRCGGKPGGLFDGNFSICRRLCGRLLGGGGCSGEVYWSEWHNDPPRCYDPCNCHGEWVGPAQGPIRAR